MIDLDNIKDSLLDSWLWTESELKDFLRPLILQHNGPNFTFDPFNRYYNLRYVILVAVIRCPKESQPAFTRLRERLKGTRVEMARDFAWCSDETLRIIFSADRFTAIEP